MDLINLWKKSKVLNIIILGIYSKYYFLLIICLSILTIILSFGFGLITAFRIVFGTIYSLFLPGFMISHILFKVGKIGYVERGVLSFVLSISIIPLVIFYFNLAGVRITSFSTFFIILLTCVLSGVIVYFKNKKPKRQQKQ